MNLLDEGVKTGKVIKTELKKKLTLDGITDEYPIYKVKLDSLYFNDRNDRIATRISQYKAEEGVSSFNMEDKEKYNALIHSFIKNSNLDEFKKIKTNINLINQAEPGIALNDGRIIDGNRRFTSLRELAKDNPKFNYFETVILDKNIDNYEKEIKILELTIQQGVTGRLDYDPIDRLVGIYFDLIKNKLLTPKEYANTIFKDEKEIQKEMEVAQLVVDFLSFINAPEQFYIARDLTIDGPIRELHAALKKISDTVKKEQTKNIVFAHIAMKTSEDPTRYIRKIKKLASSPYLDELIDNSMEITEKIVDALPPEGKVDKNAISELRTKTDIKEPLRKEMDKAIAKVDSADIRNKPVQDLEKAKDLIEEINTDIFIKLDKTQLSSIRSLCTQILSAVKDVEGHL